jgi:hypothetical protein
VHAPSCGSGVVDVLRRDGSEPEYRRLVGFWWRRHDDDASHVHDHDAAPDHDYDVDHVNDHDATPNHDHDAAPDHDHDHRGDHDDGTSDDHRPRDHHLLH